MKGVRLWRRRCCIRLMQACGLRSEIVVGGSGGWEDREVRATKADCSQKALEGSTIHTQDSNEPLNTRRKGGGNLCTSAALSTRQHCLITCNRCSSPSSDAATRFNPETDSTQVCACDAPPVVLIPPAHLARLRLLPATTSASRTSLVPVLASAPSTHTSPSAHGLQAPAPLSHSPVPRRFLPLSATPC